ncbi:unnamed protein product [Rhodiola kirilowii]
MAEALGAGVAIAAAVSKLGQFLHEQASFLFDIRDKIERLKKELSWMQSFLEDAEKKLDDSSLIREWVSDVRDLAYECEDVIDTFLVKLSGPETQPSCTGSMSRCFVAYTAKLPSTYDLGCQIEKLMTKVNDISSRRQRYGLGDADVSTTSNSREKKLMQIRISASYANDEEDMVGVSETISLLEGKLTNGGSGRFVISIHGMGGLGKTTLARKLYNSLRQEYFESYSWVCVSQEYNPRDILLDLIKSMVKPELTKEDLERMTTKHSMEAYLRNWLSGRRFLVVIDDVWERDAWESLEKAFPDNNNSSRVIITTRNQHVATLNTAYVHELRYLQEDESWELFCKKAFRYNIGMICPPDLKPLAKEMVTKCSGLPLAIITLGGLLSTKSQVLSEWEMVQDNLWKELKKDSVHINAVLLLSYNDLPQNLKPCFLYVSMFPEDFEIPISKLILMWVAEGFIGQEEEGSPEDTAKSYFNELVGRSLIQKKGEDWILSNTCRVHDLLRDMAIRKAKEMCFSLYHDGKTTSKLSEAVPHRRLTYMACDNIPSSYINPSLRTFCQPFSSNSYQNRQWTTASEKMIQSLFECFSLLRVLDIQVGISSYRRVLKIPGEIGRLIHLRYLGLSHNSREVKFPKTISNLKALETLSVESSRVTLPETIVKLKNLRHLIVRIDFPGDWIGKLTGLETLREVSYDQWCDTDTTCLVNLRHVFVDMIPQDEANPTKFYDKFKSLTMLQTLALNCMSVGLGWISASEIFKRCPSITHFSSILMSYNQSADLHEFAVNLQVLEMVLNDLRLDPIPSIKKLPKLRALRIRMVGTRLGTNKQLICSDGGFTQLRTLKIETNGDSEFVVEEGNLPSLTHLEVDEPDKIIVPDTMKHLIIKTSS